MVNFDDLRLSINSLDEAESSVTLFKFRGINQNLFRVLNERALYFSPPNKLNDPFDCQIDLCKALDQSLDRLDCNKYSNLKKLKSLSNELKIFESSISQYGVCSFTTNISNNLMWTHYADNHQGVCLVFNFPESYVKNIPYFFGLFDVSYTSYGIRKWFDLEAGNYLDGLEESLPDEFIRALIEVYLSTKSSDWRYEKEVRLITKKYGSVAFDPSFLKGVCFGLNVDQKDVVKLKEVLLNNGFSPHYYHLINGDGDFELQIDGFGFDMKFDGRNFPFAHRAPNGLVELLKRDRIRRC